MESKICTQSKKEKHKQDFYKKYTECKYCNSKRILKLYFDNEDKISNQQKIYFEKKREKLIQTQNIRYKNFKKLLRS